MGVFICKDMVQKYKIVVAYDGTDFHGWQVQPNETTIVGTLQNSFLQSFGKTVSILGASRTDAGVHAIGQVALCKTEFGLEPEQLKYAWNNALPKSIVIRSLERAGDDFYPFAYVVSKTYYYHIFLQRPLPFVARYGWFWKFIDRVDWQKFETAMQLFVGTHDFRSLCKNEEGESTIRAIDSIGVKTIKRFGTVRVEIKGKGFLRYQIRRIIGAALDVASKPELSVKLIKQKLKNTSDQQEFTRADACGLCLRKIVYGEKK